MREFQIVRALILGACLLSCQPVTRLPRLKPSLDAHSGKAPGQRPASYPGACR
jgi:hypothetical protein